MPDLPLLADHPDGPDVALVRAAVEVTGTPAQVWWAVGSGAGLGTWYVPTTVEERVGGALVSDHGPFGHVRGTVVALDAPRRFGWEEREWGADVPPWRTELVVDAASDGRSRVRLTSGLTDLADGYRTAVDATAEGWIAGLRNLRLVREHFPDQPAGGVRVVRRVGASRADAWASLLRALGLQRARPGDEVMGAAGAPLVVGVVEEVGETSLLVRTSAPAPGLLELSAHALASTSLVVHAHFFGPGGAVVAQAERPRWGMWLHARFPGARPI